MVNICQFMQVSLRVEGQNFNVIYRPDKVGSSAMARRLCSENAAAIGVTEESFGACTDRVGEFLLSAERQFVNQRTIAVSFT